MADYSMVRGDTFRNVFQVMRVQLGLPLDTPPFSVDITGWTFWFTLKRYYNDPDNLAVFQGITTDGTGNVTITDALSGKVTVFVPPLSTLNMPDADVRLVFDLQGKDPAGVVYTAERGVIVVSPDVTRAV